MATEEFLGQIRKDGIWMDYARGTETAAREWYEGDRANRRIVDWIYKERILYPKPATDVATPHDDRPRQDADDTPHLAYFTHEPIMASFAWSGHIDQPIEVSYAEQGEPIDARFPFERFEFLSGPLTILTEFKRQCDEHLARKAKEYNT